MGRTVLGLNEQKAYMQLWWPNFFSRVRDGVLMAEGELLPNELCATYLVQISMFGGARPEVRVVSPVLEPREKGGLIPHMYSQERLCLYLPGTRQWSPEKPIAVTTVPWTSMWLYFYEVWRATGTWLGGGVEPESTPTFRRTRHDEY